MNCSCVLMLLTCHVDVPLLLAWSLQQNSIGLPRASIVVMSSSTPSGCLVQVI